MDTLKKYGDALKSIPPGESEAAGLKATQQNVDDATAKPTALPPRDSTVYPQDKVNPMARYGDRPGEKKLDSEGNVIPVYDQGGDVDVNDGQHQAAILKDGEKVLTPEEAAQYDKEHPKTAEAPATEAPKPTAEGTSAPEAPKPAAEGTSAPEAPKAKSFGELVDAKATEKADATAAAQPQAAPAPMPIPEEKPKMTYGNVIFGFS